MAQSPLLLSSVADCDKQESVVVWDPIPGNPIASFNGESAATGSLTVSNGVIFSAVPRKPIIQAWSFQSNSSFKRITTKGPVSALAFSDDGNFMYIAVEKSIYVYQNCSGCLIAVYEASHMASIGALVVSTSRHSALPLPLILSLDVSGLIACWPARPSPDDTVNIGNTSSEDMGTGTSHHKPLWYIVQASRGLPACAFVADGQIIAVAGSDGLKLFAMETGKLLHHTLLESRALLSICVPPQNDRFIFTGTDNGILHSIWLRDPSNPATCETSFRKCFGDAELSSTEKAITHICSSPLESTLPLLIVATQSGLVEVLRQDSSLMRLQRFSLSPGSSGRARLTGLIMHPRPNWLLDAQTTYSEKKSVTDDMHTKSRSTIDTIQPIKRHMGWQIDDTLHLQLPNLKSARLTEDYLEKIYQDNFSSSKSSLPTAYGITTFVATEDFIRQADGFGGNATEFSALKKEKEVLQARNGELMRILVANCLHY